MELFQKGKIGNVTIKNRVVMSPMGTSVDPDGGYAAKAIRYYEERARGGFGLIIPGVNMVTEKYEIRARNLLENHFHGERLNVLVDKIHAYDAKIFLQLSPGLGRMIWAPQDEPPFSASECYTYWYPNVKCRVFDKEDIAFLVYKMGNAALIAKNMGCDGVELHAYGGYLIDQFMSSQWNLRTDEYGGDLMGRMKFTLDIIAEIQRVCGKDFPISVKYSAAHGYEGGRELSEGVAMAKILESAGVALLNVDVGFYDKWYLAIPTTYQKAGYKFFASEAVKQAVNIPVVVPGKLTDPMIAESGIVEGKTDFIELAHQSLADPQWPNKVKSGKYYDIRWCIGCNECLYADFLHREKTCAINVLCYHEDEFKLQPKSEEIKRSVLVIGGGPGGLNAAACASERGFDVKLWEKSDKLGGQILAAGAPKIKKDVAKYLEYLVTRVNRLNVDITLGKEASAEEIIDGKYDKVILASGAKEIIPPIEGIMNANVMTAIDALTSEDSIDGEVVIIGGGVVGIEAALHLINTAKKVTIVEMLDDIMKTAKHSRNVDLWLRHAIEENKINVICSAKVKSISVNDITYEKNSEEAKIPCDRVIVAAGFRSVNILENALDGKVKDLSVIGDARSARKIINAIHEGHHAIRVME